MPMRRTSTLLYLFENFNNEENEIVDFSLYEFSDVLEELNIKSISPRDEVINKILEFAKTDIQ
ncbi:MAG: hypothetical protein A2W99_09865 [Bacteroidetes bacterium GWF2_33_16]|nr:MAG: hypothetical protein A2X00_06775 [Bacteroidetes bacterium GWE2_32_14]OFY07298.1 MAG: hypothetical protein A2W99_09865 [Bacteroidetes bacterium GWF2_33_16]